MIFSEFCTHVSSQSMGYESQYRYLKQLFRSANIKRNYSDDYLKSIYNGTKHFTYNMKRHFPSNIDIVSIKDFFEKHLQDDKLEQIADSFGISKLENIDKSNFCMALAIQFQSFIKSKSEDIECLVSSEYRKQILISEKSNCGPIKPLYSGDGIWIEKVPFRYNLNCYEKVTHTWVIHNDGTVIWQNRTLKLKNTNELKPKFSETQITIPETNPHTIIKITTSIDARGSEGIHNAIWEMQDSDGNNCFPSNKKLFEVEINVTFNANLTEETND
ncbi:NBR1-Ig-like domain-containing protein [Eubacteriales bacterium KG125]